MKKSQVKIVPEYFKPYISLVADIPLIDGLKNGGIELFENNMEQLIQLGNNVYAEGKWTANQMVEHLSDTERIFLARAVRISRNDRTAQPSYNHDNYVNEARSNDQSIDTLVEDYRLARQSTISFFTKLSEEELKRIGILGENEISVLAIGFLLIGHPIHHFSVLEEKYFSLIP